MTEHEETAAVETESNPKKTSAVGGFVGAALGSRISRAGAVVGAVVGGTVGYLAGAVGRSPAETTETDPVAIDVDDDEAGEDLDTDTTDKE